MNRSVQCRLYDVCQIGTCDRFHAEVLVSCCVCSCLRSTSSGMAHCDWWSRRHLRIQKKSIRKSKKVVFEILSNGNLRRSTSARTYSSRPRPRGVRSAFGPRASSDSWISWMIVCNDSKLDDFFSPRDGPRSPTLSSASRLRSAFGFDTWPMFASDSIEPRLADVSPRLRRSRSSRIFLFRWYVPVSLASSVACRFSDMLRRPTASRANVSIGGLLDSSDNWLEYVTSDGEVGDVGVFGCIFPLWSFDRFSEVSIENKLKQRKVNFERTFVKFLLLCTFNVHTVNRGRSTKQIGSDLQRTILVTKIIDQNVELKDVNRNNHNEALSGLRYSRWHLLRIFFDQHRTVAVHLHWTPRVVCRHVITVVSKATHAHNW